MSEASTYRPLKPMAFSPPVIPASVSGERAELCLLPLSSLVVDDRYQRAIGKQGKPNVQRILAGFDWRKFIPVVVTPVGDGRFAIIDGQHRATAALMHPSIDMVPCMVVKVTPEEAAMCFAAINGVVTKITLGQIWKARVTARESAAMQLQRVLDAAEVRVLTYKVPGQDYQTGDTLAIGTLEKMLAKHGPEVLTTALQAVTQSADGNAGCLVASVIVAMCEIVAEVGLFQVQPSKLFELMDEIKLETEIVEATVTARRERKKAVVVLGQRLRERLLAGIAQAEAPPETGKADGWLR